LGICKSKKYYETLIFSTICSKIGKYKIKISTYRGSAYV